MNNPNNIMIADGILSRVAKLTGRNDADARELIMQKTNEFKAEYADASSAGHAFFDEVEMLVLHVIGSNRMFTQERFNSILADVDVYEAVIQQLRDILRKAYASEERLNFTMMLKKFYEKLNKPHRAALDEYMSDIKRMLQLEKAPANPSPNVQGLMQIVADAKAYVPSYVNPSKAAAFQIDRVGMVCDLLAKLNLMHTQGGDARAHWK